MTAYAKYDQQIGYIQGMNFIVGALLYHCSEEIAFWLFVSIIEDHNLRDVYSPKFPGLTIHTKTLGILFGLNFPKVLVHLVHFPNK